VGTISISPTPNPPCPSGTGKLDYTAK